MARSKRQYGTGCLLRRGRGFAIRWREVEIAPDGTRRRVLRYEALGDVTRKQASDALARRIAGAGGKTVVRSRVTFSRLTAEWDRSVLPMYKHSTQKHRRYILRKHLLPWFGDRELCELTRQDIQAFIAHLTQQGLAPRTIDHIHDVLSAILRTARKWGHLPENLALGVELPKMKNVRPKWALTPGQAATLLERLPPLARSMVGVAILTGLRRGELFALRWRDLDEAKRLLTVREAVYDGVFSTPKTDAGSRQIPLSDASVALLEEWKRYVRRAEPGALVFGTSVGTAILPANVLRRSVFPACKALGLPNATWLTFRRTYSSWSHEKGVPGKVTAQLMGHVNVDTTLNVYTQVLDGSVRDAVQRVGSELFTIVHKTETEASAQVGK